MITSEFRRLSLILSGLCLFVAGWSIEYDHLVPDQDGRVALAECRVSIVVPEGWKAAELRGPKVNGVGPLIKGVDILWRYKLWTPLWKSPDGEVKAHPEEGIYIDVFEFVDEQRPLFRDVIQQTELKRDDDDLRSTNFRLTSPHRKKIGPLHCTTYRLVDDRGAPEPFTIGMTFIGQEEPQANGLTAVVATAYLVYAYTGDEEGVFYEQTIKTMKRHQPARE
ncbi:MAG: hypothetical protein AAF797_07515 [Planctomycetota bacterium]